MNPFLKFKNYIKQGFTFIGLLRVLAIQNVFWVYEGWIALGFIGKEIKNPDWNLQRALTIGISLVISTYLFINTAYVYIVPIDEILAHFRKTKCYSGSGVQE